MRHRQNDAFATHGIAPGDIPPAPPPPDSQLPHRATYGLTHRGLGWVQNYTTSFPTCSYTPASPTAHTTSLTSLVHVYTSCARCGHTPSATKCDKKSEGVVTSYSCRFLLATSYSVPWHPTCPRCTSCCGELHSPEHIHASDWHPHLSRCTSCCGELHSPEPLIKARQVGLNMRKPTCMHARVHACMCARMHVCMHACMHACVGGWVHVGLDMRRLTFDLSAEVGKHTHEEVGTACPDR